MVALAPSALDVDLCVVDMESILIDAQEWVLSSDSEVAGRLRTAFGAPEPEVGA